MSSNKIDKIAEHFGKIMQELGLDMTNSSLKDTPKRVAKMYVNEVFKGLDNNNKPKITTFKDELNYKGLVQVKDIKVHSYCEHHFIPFIGVAKVAYIVDKKMIGLSKLNRLVDFYCRKPQVQEKLTQEIYNGFADVLETEDVAVEIKAEHLCVKLRGIQDQNSQTLTRKLGGQFFKDDKLRNEFLNQN
jgi:GTP cyclohydrolase I